MKVAIVHDYIKEYGGAERVLEELLAIYPKAEVYTSLYHPTSLGPHKKRFEKHVIHQSFFQYIPFAHKLISPLRLLSPLAFSQFDLSSYDIVIVSQTGAYFPNFVKTGKTGSGKAGAVHVTYTHTPPRYLYGYMTARNWTRSPVVRVMAEIFNHFLRIADFHASRRVDYFIANSQEVASRIKKFYRREAEVIYPPVEVGVGGGGEKDKYYLAGGRLARAKGMDVILDAFVENGKPLKVFGKGFAGYEDELMMRLRGENSHIEFLGEVGDEQKLQLMLGARAYVFASYDEDFGITPVEAMGQGTPVIAYRSGGVQETVRDGVTGVFYDENTAEDLNKALEKFEKMKFSSRDCVLQARKFSNAAFRKKIKKFISSVL